MKKTIQIILYIVLIALSIGFIYYGNSFAKSNALKKNYEQRENDLNLGVIGRVNSVNSIEEFDDNTNMISFTAKILTGKNKNMLVNAIQSVEKNQYLLPCSVSKGDFVILFCIEDDNTTKWLFENYCRIDKIIFLILLIIILLTIFCGIKGIHTIVSLALTFLIIIYVLIPSITAGFNIYLSTSIICTYIVFMSLCITHGFNKKSITACFGCVLGILTSGGASIIMQNITKLTGYINEESTMLVQIFNYQLNLKALVFSMTMIGVLGATMDVALSISSALYEVKENCINISKKDLFKSGLQIGKDTIGTMATTLVLAYMGSSLISIIIYCCYNYPLLMLLNKEDLIIDFLQSAIGIIGILTTIPFTAFLCSLYFSSSTKIKR